jgi:biopolymer transport protein ExbB/TolQ
MENEVTQTVADPSFLQTLAVFMDEGGIFMWIILATWTFGIAISLERIKSLFTYDIDGSSLMNMIKKHVLNNDVQKAIQSCSNSNALLPMVLKSGLKRANQEKDQIQDAVDSTILEVAPKIEKRMSYLGLVANVSTLIGLLGTIYGLIESFAAVANADPASKAKLLALGISKAMNTTAFGLISAISIMVVHNILSNKSDKIIAEVEEYSLKLVDLLGTKKRKMPPIPETSKAA